MIGLSYKTSGSGGGGSSTFNDEEKLKFGTDPSTPGNKNHQLQIWSSVYSNGISGGTSHGANVISSASTDRALRVQTNGIFVVEGTDGQNLIRATNPEWNQNPVNQIPGGKGSVELYYLDTNYPTTGDSENIDGIRLYTTEYGVSINGSVGIGTTIPATKLDVFGNIRLSDTDPEIQLNLGGPRFRVPADNTLTIHSGGNSGTESLERLRVTSNGSVGIGTTNPVGTNPGTTNTLHLDGTTAALRVGPYYPLSDRDNILLQANGTDSYIRSNNERFHIYNNGGDIVFHGTPNDTENVRFTAAGNVGIGTTNPNAVVDSTNTAKLAVGIVTCNELYVNGTQITSGGAAAGDKISEGDSKAEIIDTATESKFTVEIDTAEKFSVDIAGPKIHRQDSSNEGGSLVFNRAVDDVAAFELDVYGSSSSDSGVFRIIDATGGGERFLIGPNGQIGLSGANYGTSGQVLTSNGSSSAPTWQDASGGGGGEPVGTIVAWSGTASNIPTGYQLCDGGAAQTSALQAITGANVPDLRDKFVLGASNSTGDTTYPGVSPGATGGQADAIVPDHTHPTTFDGKKYFPGGGSTNISYGGAGSYPADTFSMSNPTNGESVTNKNLPPYYALCYIIKHTATSGSSSSGGGGGTVSSGTFTATAGSPSTLESYTYDSAELVFEYTVFVKNGSNYQTQKLLVMRDGTTVDSSQYAVMYNSNLLVQLDATISGGNVNLRATPETGVSGSTTYRIKREVV